MAAKKRTAIQIETDRAEMMQLLRRGATKTMVAEKFGVTAQQIHYDFNLVMRRTAEQMTEDAKAMIAVKLEEYAEVKREAWAAWEKSKLDAQKKVREASKGADGKAGGGKVVETVEGQSGDPRYLQTVLECLKKECELLALEPAKEMRVTGSVINWDVLAAEIGPGPVPDVVEQALQAALAVPALPAPVETHEPA